MEYKMIPISDINPAKNTPFISRFFIVFSGLVFIFIQPKNNIDLINFFYKYSAIPCEVINRSPLAAISPSPLLRESSISSSWFKFSCIFAAMGVVLFNCAL